MDDLRNFGGQLAQWFVCTTSFHTLDPRSSDATGERCDVYPYLPQNRYTLLEPGSDKNTNTAPVPASVESYWNAIHARPTHKIAAATLFILLELTLCISCTYSIRASAHLFRIRFGGYPRHLAVSMQMGGSPRPRIRTQGEIHLTSVFHGVVTPWMQSTPLTATRHLSTRVPDDSR